MKNETSVAPEIIELNGATSKSDIWSVGCTAIELMTGQPPYFELAAMPALFRIVQDEHPPLPDGISSNCTDWMLSAFKKGFAVKSLFLFHFSSFH